MSYDPPRNGHLHLGVLDLCQRYQNLPSSAAIYGSVHLAIACEKMGYRRYWLAEHHTPDAALSCPDLLLPLIGVATTTIRLGLGGVIVKYQSTRRVAEVAFALESMFPGRVDIGMSRGPGVKSNEIALELVSGNTAELTHDSFQTKIERLAMYLNSRTGTSLYSSYEPAPLDVLPPKLWILGSSRDSRELAKKTKAGLAFSLLPMGRYRPEAPALSSDSAERIAGAEFSPIVAISTICMNTQEDANQEDQKLVAAGLLPSNVVGDQEQCARQIRELSSTFSTNEFLISSWQQPLTERVKTYERLANSLL